MEWTDTSNSSGKSIIYNDSVADRRRIGKWLEFTPNHRRKENPKIHPPEWACTCAESMWCRIAKDFPFWHFGEIFNLPRINFPNYICIAKWYHCEYLKFAPCSCFWPTVGRERVRKRCGNQMETSRKIEFTEKISGEKIVHELCCVFYHKKLSFRGSLERSNKIWRRTLK